MDTKTTPGTNPDDPYGLLLPDEGVGQHTSPPRAARYGRLEAVQAACGVTAALMRVVVWSAVALLVLGFILFHG